MSTVESFFPTRPSSRLSPFTIALGDHEERERSYRAPSRVFNYLSADGDYWEIIKCSHEPQWVEDSPPNHEQIDRLARTLTFLQKPLSEDPFQKKHTMQIQFLLSNWPNVRDAFRPSRKSEKVPPYAFAEVDFEEKDKPDVEGKGRADFVGFASDGSLVIVEFGTTQKAHQVALHTLGLSGIAGPDFPIFPYAASYSRKGGTNTLDVNMGYGFISKRKKGEGPPSNWSCCDPIPRLKI